MKFAKTVCENQQSRSILVGARRLGAGQEKGNSQSLDSLVRESSQFILYLNLTLGLRSRDNRFSFLASKPTSSPLNSSKEAIQSRSPSFGIKNFVTGYLSAAAAAAAARKTKKTPATLDTDLL